MAAILAACTLLAALTACSDDPDLSPGPPAPPQIASPSSVATEILGDAIITLAPTADQFADDPAVVGFKDYVEASVLALRSQGTDTDDLFETVTGRAAELLGAELDSFRENGWRQLGAPTWEIVDLRLIDDSHRRVYACEYDAATYPVDRNGDVARPFEERWLPTVLYMVLINGAWLVENAYSGDYLCGGDSE